MLNNNSETNYVSISPDGNLNFHINNVDEAKIAIKQLRIMKKQITLAKKQVLLQQRSIRAEYTDSVRRQGTMMRGGKGLGSFVRSVQHVQRNSAKIDLANKLAPLEKEKYRFEALLSVFDQGILNLEAYIVENSK